MITITESAQDYLAELLLKQDGALGVRVFINQPGTARAETCIAYCREADLDESDEVVELAKFKVWYEGRSIPFLEDALVDYSKDRMGGQLTIKAPNAKLPRLGMNYRHHGCNTAVRWRVPGLQCGGSDPQGWRGKNPTGANSTADGCARYY